MQQLSDFRELETEAEFQASVIDFAQTAGWLVYHTYDSRKSAPGFPDLVMCRNGRIVIAELKSARGKVTPQQMMWLKTLAPPEGAVARHEVFVWRAGSEQSWREIEEALR